MKMFGREGEILCVCPGGGIEKSVGSRGRA